MLKILILILLATTSLAAHPVELDRENDGSLLSEDNFVTKHRYRLILMGTLEQLNADLSIVKVTYDSYLDCRVEDEKMLRSFIEVAFSNVDDWRYMQFIKEKFLSKVAKGAKAGSILNEWKSMLLELSMNIDDFLIKEPDFSGRGERWKLTAERMSLNKFNVSLSSIIPIEALNKKDVLFVKYEAAYKEEIEDWYQNEYNNVFQKVNVQGYNRYVLKEELLKETNTIYTDQKQTILKSLKQTMIDSILFELDEEIVTLEKLGSRINKELSKVRDQYLAQKGDSLRFVEQLFEEVYSEDKNVSFSLPKGFGLWVSTASVYENPSLLLQDYQDILLTWKSYHMETIKLFVDRLTKEKKNPQKYYLNRTKLIENLSKCFDKAKVENEIPSGFYLIEKLLLQKLPQQNKISLVEFTDFWQTFLDKGITKNIIQEHFKKYYTIQKELKWMNFLIDLLPYMPTSEDITKALYQSEF